MKDRLFQLVLDWHKNCVVPNHKKLVFSSAGKDPRHPEISPGFKGEEEIKELLINLVKKSSQKPEEVFVLL